MKKKIGLLLAALLLLVSAVCFAEEKDFPDIYFDEASIEGLEGEFISLEDMGADLGIDFELWVPDFLEQQELTEELEAANIFAVFADDDHSHIMTVSYIDELAQTTEETLDTEFILEVQKEAGFDFVPVYINDSEAGICMSEKDDAMLVLYPLMDNSIILFLISPISDEEFEPIAEIMASSMIFPESEE